jgi:L-threonylcarbamoyladenylate synthase
MGASLADLLPYVAGSEAEIARWTAVAQTYWPGALTLVLPASDRLPPAMNPEGTGTLGIRVPDHPLAQYLLGQTGPLATTSVNRSGQPPLETMAAIHDQFPEVVTLAESAIATLYPQLTSDSVPSAQHPQGTGQPSTVAAWTGHGWHILRQGAIDLREEPICRRL